MQPDALAHAISDSLAHALAHAISDSLAHARAHTIAHTKVRRSSRCDASPMHWHALCRLHTTARAHTHA